MNFTLKVRQDINVAYGSIKREKKKKIGLVQFDTAEIDHFKSVICHVAVRFLYNKCIASLVLAIHLL